MSKHKITYTWRTSSSFFAGAFCFLAVALCMCVRGVCAGGSVSGRERKRRTHASGAEPARGGLAEATPPLVYFSHQLRNCFRSLGLMRRLTSAYLRVFLALPIGDGCDGEWDTGDGRNEQVRSNVGNA
jgi:hypothetical protein